MKRSGRQPRFSPNEEKKLIRLVQKYGSDNWKDVARHFRNKSPKQCHYRWKNYANPDLNHGEWSPEEDKLLMEKYEELGTQWAAISLIMTDRAPNDLRNRWVKLRQLPEDHFQHDEPIKEKNLQRLESPARDELTLIDEMLIKVRNDLQDVEGVLELSSFEL